MARITNCNDNGRFDASESWTESRWERGFPSRGDSNQDGRLYEYLSLRVVFSVLHCVPCRDNQPFKVTARAFYRFPRFSPRGHERRANAFLATVLLPRSTTSFLSRRGFLTRVESYLDGPTGIRAMFVKRHSSSHKVIRNGEVRLFQVHGLEVVNPATRIGHG